MASTSQDESSVQSNRHADRLQFSQLIAENHQHFGNFREIKLSQIDSHTNDTTFEELISVGYNPDLGLLEAVVQIKQSSGYLGDHRTPGSFEYIRFYVNTGSGFEHAGMVAINVHDLPPSANSSWQTRTPLTYAASVPFSAPNCEDRENPMFPRVRAILSWQAIPTDPDFAVAWGNSLECLIPLKPRPTTILDVLEDMFVEGLLPTTAKERIAAVPPIPIPTPDLKPLTLAQRVELYREMRNKIPTHRFGYQEAHHALMAPTFSSDQVASTMAEFAALKIDWAKTAGALTERDADSAFEQLDSVALECAAGGERLVATFRVKQVAGYSGNLNSAGSVEYIAFWADWDNMSTFTYLGTVAVKVYDVDRAEGQDLCFMAALPVDLDAQLTGRRAGKTARIRAVLSWAVPPSTTNPNTLNFWGNAADSLVQLPAAKSGHSGGISPRPSTLNKMFAVSKPAIAAATDRTSRNNLSVPPSIPLPGSITLSASIC